MFRCKVDIREDDINLLTITGNVSRKTFLQRCWGDVNGKNVANPEILKAIDNNTNLNLICAAIHFFYETYGDRARYHIEFTCVNKTFKMISLDLGLVP